MENYTDLVTSAAPTAAARVRLRPVDALQRYYIRGLTSGVVKG